MSDLCPRKRCAKGTKDVSNMTDSSKNHITSYSLIYAVQYTVCGSKTDNCSTRYVGHDSSAYRVPVHSDHCNLDMFGTDDSRIRLVNNPFDANLLMMV